MASKRQRFAQRRKAVGYTQESFAERLGVDRNTVVRWEAGATEPQPWMRPRIARALEVSVDELDRLLTEVVEPESATGEHPTDALKHPSRVNLVVAASDGSLDDQRPTYATMDGPVRSIGVEAHLESLELDRQVEVSDLGPVTLRQLELTVERFGLAYLRTPPLEMFEAVRSCRRYVTGLLKGRHTLAEKVRLCGVAGWLSALLGHLAFDLGERPWVVHGHSATALHLAAEADLHELTAWTRGTQAMIAVYDGRPQEAVAFAEAGRRVAPEGSATVVRLWGQESRAWARMGERASVERAMAAAEAAFDGLRQKPTTSIFSFDRPYLPFYGGTAYVWLEEPKLAQVSAERAIALCDSAPADWPVARVMARIDLAASLVQQGELEGAGRIGTEALEICASGRPTDPIAKRFAELLTGFTQPSIFHDLEDRCRALLPARADAHEAPWT